MKRRSAVKQIAFMIGGSLWLPSCLTGSEQTEDPVLTGLQEEVLADLVEWLIPETDIPGAKELGVHLFVLKMLADCYDEKTQNQLSLDLDKITKHAQGASGASWEKCSLLQKESAFRHFSGLEGQDQVLTSFPVIRQRAIQGFLSSEYVLTNVFIYEMAPGRYDGYFRV